MFDELEFVVAVRPVGLSKVVRHITIDVATTNRLATIRETRPQRNLNEKGLPLGFADSPANDVAVGETPARSHEATCGGESTRIVGTC